MPRAVCTVGPVSVVFLPKVTSLAGYLYSWIEPWRVGHGLFRNGVAGSETTGRVSGQFRGPVPS